MSSQKWIVKQTIFGEGERVEFQVLVEDTRSMMCDSLKPQYDRVPGKHRIVYYNRQNFPTSTLSVSKDLGNYYYKQMRECQCNLRHMIEQCWLDVAAYHDDFDCYSDMYKDMYNVRPHYTHDQWDDIVRRARNLR